METGGNKGQRDKERPWVGQKGKWRAEGTQPEAARNMALAPPPTAAAGPRGGAHELPAYWAGPGRGLRSGRRRGARRLAVAPWWGHGEAGSSRTLRRGVSGQDHQGQNSRSRLSASSAPRDLCRVQSRVKAALDGGKGPQFWGRSAPWEGARPQMCPLCGGVSRPPAWN